MGLAETNPAGVRLIVIEALFYGLAIGAVGLRIWSRRLKRRALGLDDYAVVVGLIFAGGLLASEVVAVVVGGAGRHLIDVSVQAQIRLQKCFLAAEILWVAANTPIKISILAFYITIFRNRTFRHIAHGLMVVTICYFFAIVLEALFLCRPIQYGWNKSIHGVCGNQQLGFLLTGIVNMIIDVCIVLLPMPMLWGLQMPLMKKLAISGIFGMGFAICIISAFRIKSIADLDFMDFTYSLINDGIWSALEPLLGIVNACLPILQPVIAKVGETSLFSRSRGSSKAGNSKGSSDQSSTKPLHPDESDTKNFHRLYNHVYPLEDNPVVSNQNESSCFGTAQTPNETNSLKQITVTTNWNVHTSSVSAV